MKKKKWKLFLEMVYQYVDVVAFGKWLAFLLFLSGVLYLTYPLGYEYRYLVFVVLIIMVIYLTVIFLMSLILNVVRTICCCKLGIIEKWNLRPEEAARAWRLGIWKKENKYILNKNYRSYAMWVEKAEEEYEKETENKTISGAEKNLKKW